MKMKRCVKLMWRKVAARPAMRSVNELLFDCALHGLGILNYENDTVSGEDHFINHLLPHYATGSRPVFVDVGANLGCYSQCLSQRFPESLRFACEANPKTARQLKANLDGEDVTLVSKAMGSENGTIRLFDREDCDGSSGHGSVYKDVIEEIHSTQSVEYEVPITTLDDLVAEHDLQSIQLLKIDTEGHELEVLKGAETTLNRGLIDLVHVEFNEMNIISRVFFRDLAVLLENYTPYRLLPHGVLPLKQAPLRRELFAFQNVVFVNKRFSPNRRMLPQQTPRAAAA